jgi:calcineurin-like phosphoesterase family protein
VEEMNEVLIQKWNNLVTPEDEVYYLGDFSMAARPVEIYTTRLNGTKYLVPGNHDFCHSYNKKSRTPERHTKWLQQYQDWGVDCHT